MKIDVNSVHAGMTSEYADISLGWSDTEGNRYHVWFDRKTRVKRDDIMYKNSHLSVTYKGPGYFPTRYLSLSAKANMEAFTEALRISNDKGLFDKAVAIRGVQQPASKQERAWHEAVELLKRVHLRMPKY